MGATVVAVAVALVATLVYASIDAGRPVVESGPTTAPGAPQATPVTQPEEETTTTKPPENLSPEALEGKVSASVRTVRSLDEGGQPTEGTAFVVGSFGGQTLLLTSLAVVRAATRAPSPPINLGDGQEATLWTWEEGRDLALLVVPGAIASLPWINSSAGIRPGEKIYAGAPGRLSAGVIVGTSSEGIEHNIVVDGPLQGAPLVNQKGEVLAMASRAYNPGGTGTETVFTGIPIGVACEQVLRCGGGNTRQEGTSTTQP